MIIMPNILKHPFSNISSWICFPHTSEWFESDWINTLQMDHLHVYNFYQFLFLFSYLNIPKQKICNIFYEGLSPWVNWYGSKHWLKVLWELPRKIGHFIPTISCLLHIYYYTRCKYKKTFFSNEASLYINPSKDIYKMVECNIHSW